MDVCHALPSPILMCLAVKALKSTPKYTVLSPASTSVWVSGAERYKLSSSLPLVVDLLIIQVSIFINVASSWHRGESLRGVLILGACVNLGHSLVFASLRGLFF